jgi:4a-hydroxytetrahydrobiopterin dehydratase
MQSNLASQKCVPCETWVPPMHPDKVSEMLKQIKGWESEDNSKIKKQFKFKDFKEAMVFVNKVADLAEDEGHHPNITIIYNKVALALTTHFIKGLHENDFIMASKIDQLQAFEKEN